MSFGFDDLAFPSRSNDASVRKICPSCEEERVVAMSETRCPSCGDGLLVLPAGAGAFGSNAAAGGEAQAAASDPASQAMMRHLMGSLAAAAAASNSGGGGGGGDGSAGGSGADPSDFLGADLSRLFIPALNSTYADMVSAQRGVNIDELMTRLLSESALETKQPASKKFVEGLKPRRLLPRDFLQLYIRMANLPGMERDLFPTAAAFGAAGKYLDEHAQAQKAAQRAEAEAASDAAAATAAAAVNPAATPDAVGAKTTEAPSVAGPAPREHSSGPLVVGAPLTLAPPVRNGPAFRGSWVLSERGATSFLAKARLAQQHLAKGLLVLQNQPDEKAWPYTMSDSTGTAGDIIIPCVMLSQSDGAALQAALKTKEAKAAAGEPVRLSLLTRERPLACCICREDYHCWSEEEEAAKQQKKKAKEEALAAKGAEPAAAAAAAATGDEDDDEARITEAVELPCGHFYCDECIRPWLASRANCPLCRFALPTDDAAGKHADPPGPDSNNAQLQHAMYT